MNAGKCLLFALLIFVSIPGVLADPTSYITEEVSANFFTNGSMDGSSTAIGYVEVDVGNNQDVMQFILLDLSKTTGTNLLSPVAFNAVAASPNPGDRTRIFVNTTDSPQDIRYRITNSSLTPLILMKLDYTNGGLGQDINGSSVFLFNLTLSLNYSSPLSGVNLVFQAATNTFGPNDSAELFNPGATNGVATAVDTDFDFVNDRISWSGDLTPGVDTYVTFKGSITPGVNFDANNLFVDLNDFNTIASSSSSGTFTGIGFTDRFSRGPIRQGVELFTKDNNWLTRGFLRNVATGLDYFISSWALYQVGNSLLPLISNANVNTILEPNDVLYTDRFSSVGEKQFYAAEFDWEVVWGGSVLTNQSRSLLYLPTLYQIDSFVDKGLVIEVNEGSGRRVAVNEEVKHLGHINLEVNRVHINSVISAVSVSGVPVSWSVSDVRVFYTNNTDTIDITGFATITTKNTDGGDGFVFANISNITAAIGHAMRQNDEVSLSYKVSGPIQPDTQNYSFYSELTLFTLSGTPMKRNITSYIVIPGVVISGGPGPGPGGGEPIITIKEVADIVKVRSDVFFITRSLVDVDVLYKIFDTGTKGIRNIKLGIFVPEKGELDTSRITLKIFDSSEGKKTTLERGTDYIITDRGVTNIGERRYREFLIEIKTKAGELIPKTLDLFNGDTIEISYVTKIPSGTSYILTRAFGYNFYEDKFIFEDAYIAVRSEGPLTGLDITERDIRQSKAIIGRPVTWVKEYEIYNPNEVGVEDIIKTPVFNDAMSVYLNDGSGRAQLKLERDNQTYVSWIAKVKAGERKVFKIEINTPPVLEINRDTTILEFDKTRVKLALNLTIKNFANEDYLNVTYPFSTKKRNIISVEGKDMSYTEQGNITEIVVSRLSSKQNTSLSIIYIEIPPVLITYLNSREYARNETANLTIIIIPAEYDERPYVEVEITGPDSDIRTVFVDLIELGVLEEGKETKASKSFTVGLFPSGRYVVNTKFKKDFDDILTDQQEFFVTIPEINILELGYIIIIAITLLVALIALAFFQLYRKRGYKEEIRELKKEIEKL